MEGKVAVVTGANSGVGLETAVALASGAASASGETNMISAPAARQPSSTAG